jgi:hypothetical protein
VEGSGYGLIVGSILEFPGGGLREIERTLNRIVYVPVGRDSSRTFPIYKSEILVLESAYSTHVNIRIYEFDL